jgi:hypothetical protein
MIIVEHEHGGLRLARWDGTDPRPLETFFVADSELAALIADLLARATQAPAAAEWDLFAYFCGNDQATPEMVVQR